MTPIDNGKELKFDLIRYRMSLIQQRISLMLQNDEFDKDTEALFTQLYDRLCDYMQKKLDEITT